ncbi:MAG: class I SAM-dependent methyltransferase [Snowella sp.]|nr:class I SAM-dependent methyltransferase [Snowella sp.]
MSGIQEGHYYQRQFDCSCSVIAWSHSSRFKVALQLLGDKPQKVLDYGCGDGTFLAMAADRIQQGKGVDVSSYMINSCKTRLADIPNVSFAKVDELDPADEQSFDVVTCMETLEHCLEPSIDIVLKDLARLVSPQGKVIISVPIEIGPTFFFKQVIRWIAGVTSLPEYRDYEVYPLKDALRMVFANHQTKFERPIYTNSDEPYYPHYGFNWRAMRKSVEQYLVVEKTSFSPLGFLGGWFSSQVWFICRKP